MINAMANTSHNLSEFITEQISKVEKLDKPLNTKVSQRLLDELDAVAREIGITRSELIRAMLDAGIDYFKKKQPDD